MQRPREYQLPANEKVQLAGFRVPIKQAQTHTTSKSVRFIQIIARGRKL